MDIVAKYNGSSEAAHAHIDDDRYDMAKYGAAGKPKLDLLDQLGGCSISYKCTIHLCSANTLYGYCCQV